ncbi:MAG: PilZ domain-containing protein [Candidatus Omnitrophica bacterium]|nr:PilZ domain-containing protein [Candidatus Omnitrophota bacterium]
MDDKRINSRYHAAYPLDFSYDVRTKIKIQIKEDQGALQKKHAAFSQNISTDGLCFVSKYKLHKGDALHLELFLPGSDKAIGMEGEVRWSKTVLDDKIHKSKYNTGVKLLSVDGQSVPDTVCFDSTYHVAWSIVLERVFNTYKFILKKNKDDCTPLEDF